VRFLFSSTRGAGHVQPLLPYAKALVAKGHDVLVAGPQDLSGMLQTAGLKHAPFAHPGDEGLAPLWARLRLVPAEQQTAVVVREIFAGANARAAFPGVSDTIRTWQPQLIVREAAEFAVLVAAEAAGVPHVRVAVHHRAAEEQICSLAAEPIDRLRETAGLPADAGAALRAEKSFTSFPESFEGSPNAEVTGPVYRVGPVKEVPSAASSAWSPNTDGLPFVYITFGTVATTVPEARQLYQTAIAAVADLPVRVLLTTGRGFELGILGTVPANVQVEAWVPQAEVFPHTAVLVCHGGSGTVLGGLAAGIPQVVVPLGADQPQNAQSIAAIGAGLALNKPDAPTLRAAIARVLSDSAFRDAARAVSREMLTLHSIDEAADALVDLAAP
jgi:UDP:flavonoid glycosyltransferase YjiC (YdhE family)